MANPCPHVFGKTLKALSNCFSISGKIIMDGIRNINRTTGIERHEQRSNLR
jgi:hypothetical protein